MFKQKIELSGHIIDSFILARTLDEIIDHDGSFIIEEFKIGRTKNDPSYVLLEVEAESEEGLNNILSRVQELGAAVLTVDEVQLQKAPRDGVFPEGFYATTNLETFIYWQGSWHKVKGTEMDCGIVVDVIKAEACCTPINRIKAGDHVVVGGQGIKVVPLERSRRKGIFTFMGSSVSSERAKGLLIKEISNLMKDLKRAGGNILVVAGPAVVHTGSGQSLVRLIEAGYVDCIFAGNALATHDIELALLGTSHLRPPSAQSPFGKAVQLPNRQEHRLRLQLQ
jgi:lysine-ketoglutarate reductase/saccharopine dehydrogenase-like protein (TIGR00300 family)